MSRRRFYASAASFDIEGTSVTLSSEETRHLRDVLRLSIEDSAFVFDGEGHEYECVVSEVRGDFARLRVISEVSPTNQESTLQLTIAVSLLKGEKFDLVVQKCTELGVNSIVPVMTKFADVRLRDKSDADRRVARWQRIALEAAKQSGRASVPQVSVPADLMRLLKTPMTKNEACLMFSERLGESFEAATSEIPHGRPVIALVGSEGGWADEEISQARDSGWRIATLRGRTLRAETAAIVVTALLQHRLGDLL